MVEKIVGLQLTTTVSRSINITSVALALIKLVLFIRTTVEAQVALPSKTHFLIIRVEAVETKAETAITTTLWGAHSRNRRPTILRAAGRTLLVVPITTSHPLATIVIITNMAPHSVLARLRVLWHQFPFNSPLFSKIFGNRHNEGLERKASRQQSFYKINLKRMI